MSVCPSKGKIESVYSCIISNKSREHYNIKYKT